MEGGSLGDPFRKGVGGREWGIGGSSRRAIVVLAYTPPESQIHNNTQSVYSQSVHATTTAHQQFRPSQSKHTVSYLGRYFPVKASPR